MPASYIIIPFIIIKRITVFVCFVYFSLHFARHTHGNYICRNRLGYNASCAYNRIISDCYACQNNCACSDPDVISDFDWLCNFYAIFAHLRVDRMFSSSKSNIRTYKNIITKCYSGTVLNDKIMICIKIVTYFNVITIVTPKRRNKCYFLPHFTKQIPEYFLLFFTVIWIQLIITIAFILTFFYYFLILGIITTFKKAI